MDFIQCVQVLCGDQLLFRTHGRRHVSKEMTEAILSRIDPKMISTILVVLLEITVCISSTNTTNDKMEHPTNQTNTMGKSHDVIYGGR